ncbi:MAG TPA: YraN family protein [Candidatus Paceibacterota bacterium]
MAYNRLIGDIGEEIACKWLKKHNFLIIERNYSKKWGEIDIIVAKDGIIHFIEVKSIIVKKTNNRSKDEYRPEENVHELKCKRLKRAVQTYLLERKYKLDTEFQFHVIVVRMDQKTRRAKVTFMENVIL